MILSSPKQEKFCQLLASGESGTQAYKTAYGQTDENSAGVGANRLLKTDSKIQARIEEIKAQIDKSAVRTAVSCGIDKLWILDKLRENVLRSLQCIPVLDKLGNPIGIYKYDGTVANQALSLLGKEIGMFRERLEILQPRIQETMNAMGADVRAVVLGLDLPEEVKTQVLDALARKWTDRLRPLLEAGTIVHGQLSS